MTEKVKIQMSPYVGKCETATNGIKDSFLWLIQGFSSDNNLKKKKTLFFMNTVR